MTSCEIVKLEKKTSAAKNIPVLTNFTCPFCCARSVLGLLTRFLLHRNSSRITRVIPSYVIILIRSVNTDHLLTSLSCLARETQALNTSHLLISSSCLARETQALNTSHLLTSSSCLARETQALNTSHLLTSLSCPAGGTRLNVQPLK